MQGGGGGGGGNRISVKYIQKPMYLLLEHIYSTCTYPLGYILEHIISFLSTECIVLYCSGVAQHTYIPTLLYSTILYLRYGRHQQSVGRMWCKID